MSCNLGTWFVFLCVCLAFETIQGQDKEVIVESGTKTTLECPLNNSATRISWTTFSKGQSITVSTCDPGIPCVDTQAPQYTAQTNTSSRTSINTLQIASARWNETNFECSIDTESFSFVLGVYVWPRNLTCSNGISLNGEGIFALLNCVSDKVYPGFQMSVYTQEKDLPILSTCQMTNHSSKPTDDYTGSCEIEIPISELRETNIVYVRMYPRVLNHTVTNRPPVVSSGNNITFALPKVTIYRSLCPMGPGVNGDLIKIGTTATCRCDFVPGGGLINGAVKWYTNNETVTGTEDPSGQFSTITVSYNPFDSNQTYDCRAVNPTGTYYHVLYTPKFTSSAPGEFTVGLSFLMLLCAVIISLV